MLSVTDLQCIRGDRCLFENLSFELNAGELLHLHGHNGSGKTTLMRTLCGLVQPAAGEISWNGENISKLQEEFTRHVMYLGHKNAIKDDLTGVENLLTSSLLDGAVQQPAAAWKALEEMGLRGFEDLPTKVLSQGQKKRVALSRLLLTETRLWVLDEPFVALDKAAVAHLQEVIRCHVANGGMVILTTHQDVELTSGTVRELKLGWKVENER